MLADLSGVVAKLWALGDTRHLLVAQGLGAASLLTQAPSAAGAQASASSA